MKICSISDLHGNLVCYPSDYWKDLWECEVLFICGDILPLEIQHDMIKSIQWLTEDFKPWAENLPVEKVFFIAGNHDFWFERNDAEANKLFPEYAKITYLKNELVKYLSDQDRKVYKIFGTPYCKIFGNWSFMRPADVLKHKFNEMPSGLDILISHDAPYGVSDICLEGRWADGKHIGNPQLRDIILSRQPTYHFHGHLHSSNHKEETLGITKVFNTSILNEEYKIQYDPLIIRI